MEVVREFWARMRLRCVKRWWKYHRTEAEAADAGLSRCLWSPNVKTGKSREPVYETVLLCVCWNRDISITTRTYSLLLLWHFHFNKYTVHTKPACWQCQLVSWIITLVYSEIYRLLLAGLFLHSSVHSWSPGDESYWFPDFSSRTTMTLIFVVLSEISLQLGRNIHVTLRRNCNNWKA